MDRSSTRLDSNGRCGSLNGWHKGFKRHDCGRVEKERHALSTRRDFLQQLGPLTGGCRIDCREPGDVAAWMREARGEAAVDRIGYYREHDRNCSRFAGKGSDHGCGCTEDRVGSQIDQLFG